MFGKCIMLQGTSSNVGKSILSAGLCRLFYRAGLKVAPFKSQNMSLNSYVTKDGGEIGRAQGMQAEAAGVTAVVEMNPILLKPKKEMLSQVIVKGKPLADMSAREYWDNYLPEALIVVTEALNNLRQTYELLVIEGAGNPAEINLKDKDIVNMKIAFLADAPVILVADIDQGGAFASIIGTLELLTVQERKQIAGFIINKFKGDPTLLAPAIDYLEKRTGLPVLGVMPFIDDLEIGEEDSVSLLEKNKYYDNGSRDLNIVIIKLPRISNYHDFDPLRAEKDVTLRYVAKKEGLGSPDAVIIPGTKNTTADLLFLYSSGLAEAISKLAAGGTPVVGVCGGYQILGEDLNDPAGTESDHIISIKGLGLLPITTTFSPEKLTRRIKAKFSSDKAWGDLANLELEGYEIRHGKSEVEKKLPYIQTLSGIEGEIIGLASANGLILGTYLHNLFHNDLFRRRWLNTLRRRHQLPLISEEKELIDSKKQLEENYDRLAAILKKNLDLKLLYRIAGIE